MIFLVVVWVMMAFVCSYVAGQKGRSRGNHFVGGLLFSVIWLLVLIALPPASKAHDLNAPIVVRLPADRSESTWVPQTGA